MRQTTMRPNMRSAQPTAALAPPVTGTLPKISYNLARLTPAAQSNLKIGQVDDPSEHAADQAADAVMGMPDPAMTAAAKEQGSVAALTSIAGPAPAPPADLGLGRGIPMPAAVRAFFEPRFGKDLASVRIHTDAAASRSARSMGARAYALGNDIVFGSGEYRPESASGKHLIAHELAHVEQASATVLRRQPRKRQSSRSTPPPQATPDYFIDPNEKVFKQADTASLLEVGFKSADGAIYVTADDNSISSKPDGAIFLGRGTTLKRHDIRKFYILKADTLSASTVPKHTAIDKKGVVATSYRILDGAKNFELLTAGPEPSATPTPIDIAKLHTDITTKVTFDTSIHLDSGYYWVALEFKKPPATAAALHWAKAKETSSEFRKRQTKIKEVVDTLPASFKTKADKHLDLITAISVTEGNFTAAAVAEDTAASLGIFQWALDKDKTKDPNSNLVKYFQTLKKRSEAASAKSAVTRTEEDKLFVQAWKQVTDKNVDVKASGSITVSGKAATGSELQKIFAIEFGTDSLKKYQIVGALDKIDSLVDSTIRPNPDNSDPFGSGYSATSRGPEVSFFKSKFKSGKADKNFEIAVTPPASWVHCGDILNSEESLSIATTIYTNRPNSVPSALWYSIKGQFDIKPKVAALLETIAKAEHANRKILMPIDHTTLDPVSKAAYAELQKLIWVQPSEVTRKGMDIMQDMIRIALSLYPTKDLVKYERWERIATSSAPFGSPSW